MIGRSNRFHGRGSIRRLQRDGKMIRYGAFALRYVPNQRRKTYRLAVVVSRRVSKSAVVRNRIRRRIYELVRNLSSQFTTPYDMVLVVYDERIATLPAEELSSQLTKLIKKTKLSSATPSRRAIVEPKE